MADILSAIMGLFAWLPSPLNVLFCGAIACFLIYCVIKLIKLIMDVIPFA